MEPPQQLGQVVHPVEADQGGVEAGVAVEVLLQEAEVRLVPHAVFDKEEGARGAGGRSSRRQDLDLRSHSTLPQRSCCGASDAAAGAGWRPVVRSAPGWPAAGSPLLILDNSTEGDPLPRSTIPRIPGGVAGSCAVMRPHDPGWPVRKGVIVASGCGPRQPAPLVIARCFPQVPCREATSALVPDRVIRPSKRSTHARPAFADQPARRRATVSWNPTMRRAPLPSGSRSGL